MTNPLALQYGPRGSAKGCDTCSKPLSARAKTGRCSTCNLNALMADAEFIRSRSERRNAALKASGKWDTTLSLLAQTARSQLSWCPLEYRDDYRALRSGNSTQRLKAHEARALIEKQIAFDARQAVQAAAAAMLAKHQREVASRY